MHRAFSIVFIFCLLYSHLSAAEYYVAPTGADTNPGTLNAPFRTIAHARDAVKTVSAAMTADIHVYLRGGWYRQEIPLTFDASDSGQNGHDIIYQAYPGEYPLISGGRQISGWTRHDRAKNIWQAPAPGLHTRQLYVNDQRAMRAQKRGGFDGPCTLTPTGYTIGPMDARMAGWHNQSDIELVFRGGSSGSGNPQWTERRCGIQRIAGNTLMMKQSGWRLCTVQFASNRQDVTAGPTNIENAYELLDEPGEWYWDRSAEMLYYIPRAHEQMNKAIVIAPMLETLMSIAGTLDNPIHNLQFIGITFTHATFMRPSADDGWAEIEDCYLRGASFARMTRTPGNISVQTAQHLRFERCVFTHLGAAGLDIAGGSQDNQVIGCVFTDISATCLQLGSVNDPLRADIRARDSGNQILNCYIHDSPCEFHGGCGIMAAYVSDTLISHNEIRDTPLIGVNIGWGWGRMSYMEHNQLTFNCIHDCMRMLADGGCCKTLSPMPNSTINNNYFYGARNVQGCIYLDNGSSHLDVYRNVCQQVGQDWIHLNNDNNDVRDNTIHENYTDTPHLRFAGSSNRIAGTVVMTGTLLPETAREIMLKAGLEPAYRDILTMPSACAVMSPNQSTTTPDKAKLKALLPLPTRWNNTPVQTTLQLINPFAPATTTATGCIRLTVRNFSMVKACGQIHFALYPNRGDPFHHQSEFRYALAPGRMMSRDLRLTLPPGTYQLITEASAIGIMPSQLTIEAPLLIPRITADTSLEQMATVLAPQHAWTFQHADIEDAGEIRFAIIGDALAISARLYDIQPRRTDTGFEGSRLEIYGAPTRDGKICRVFLAPQVGEIAPATLRFDGAMATYPAPNIKLHTQLVAGGYTLQAVVPLDYFGIAGDAQQFYLECMLNTRLPGKPNAQLHLFHSTAGFSDTRMYERITICK